MERGEPIEVELNQRRGMKDMDDPTARTTVYSYLVSMGVQRDMRRILAAAAFVMLRNE